MMFGKKRSDEEGMEYGGSPDKAAMMKKFAERRKAKMAPKKGKKKKKTTKRRAAKKAVKKGRKSKMAARRNVGDQLNDILGMGPDA